MSDEQRNQAKIQVEMFLDHLKDRYDVNLSDLVQMKKHLVKVTGWQNWIWSLVRMVLVVLMWEGLQHITGWVS